MGSKVDQVDATIETTGNRTCLSKTKGKVPKRVHKAEREKLKREQLNELFDELAFALDVSQPNNGKASILDEATRLLKDSVRQIDKLEKEKMSLLSESHYVTVEKDELREENSALESLIDTLRSELRARLAQSKPDLNELPPESQQPEFTLPFLGDSLGLAAADSALQQPSSSIFAVPLHPNLPDHPTTRTRVRKPHARYPTPMDLWPSQLLGEQLSTNNGVQSGGSK